MTPHFKCSATAASHRLRRPLATASGSTSVSLVPNSCGRLSTNSLSCPPAPSAWAKAYYDRQRAQEQSHPAAIRALAYKWIRIIFRCWKEGKLYDEQVHLRSLQKRHSPLGVPNTVVGWKPVAGFQKFSANPS